MENEVPKPWTIRNVPVGIRKAVAKVARGQTGQWVGAAIDTWIASDQQPQNSVRAAGADVKPWTVKGIPFHARTALTHKAHGSQWDIADLLVAAIEARLTEKEAEETNAGSAQPGKAATDRLAAIVGLCDDLLKTTSALRDLCRDEATLRRL